ncbi:MAG: amidohydrolase family protein [Acidobacteriota bacterium]|nr:amidohydrolase family protein [Acidobacteriota bacterium]
MTSTEAGTTAAGTAVRDARSAIIDCDLHNELDSIKDLYPYLSERHRHQLDTFGLRAPNSGYYPRFMDHREEARPPSGRKPGSEVGFMAEHFLDPYNVAYGILNPLTGASSALDLELGAAIATAANDWQVEKWLDPEPRLRASVVIHPEYPEAAAAEIRRRSEDPRFVQVLFMGRVAEPMGRRKYWPVYEACAEGGLHVASHAFGMYGNPITGAGHASYYIEDHTGPPQAIQANVTSLVVEGVFDRFPVNLISVENGFGWIPSLMWRLDSSWELLREEVPHLDRPPSEIVAERLWVSTQPIEEPRRSEDFGRLIGQFGSMAAHLMIASDYPHWDGDNPDLVLPNSLPAETRQAIRYDNAATLYGL